MIKHKENQKGDDTDVPKTPHLNTLWENSINEHGCEPTVELE